MKAINLRLEFRLAGMAGEPDWANGTTIDVDGDRVWPAGDQTVDLTAVLKPGAAVVIAIPSGTLTGTVQRASQNHANDTNIYGVIEGGAWRGKWGGLTGGLCALGAFQWTDGRVVCSSALSDGETVDLAVYSMVNSLAGWSVPAPSEEYPDTVRYPDPEEKRDRMARIFAAL